MKGPRTPLKGYMLAGLLGASLGGITVALASRALPAMISRVMSDVMAGMLSQMAGEGCDPADI